MIVSMQDNLAKITHDLTLLDSLCNKGELEEATELFLKIDSDIKKIANSIEPGVDEELRLALFDVYNQFTLTLQKLHALKKDVGNKLREYISSKKKLKAYNDI